MNPLVIPSDQRIVDIRIGQPWRDVSIEVVLASGTVLGGRVHGRLDDKALRLLSDSQYREPGGELFEWLHKNVHAVPLPD